MLVFVNAVDALGDEITMRWMRAWCEECGGICDWLVDEAEEDQIPLITVQVKALW